MRIDLGVRSWVDVEPDVKEEDEVTVHSVRHEDIVVTWGSVIAMTNGEAQLLLEQKTAT